ncbi:50S ribosomal protein L5 [Patescibacteria group bacterium]|nr:50S ribosomal protein L5 [Patescibacteria group bacterium]MBU1016438.1 50S ribosomal protein L5 [Patescibacteria group bacterium]MBU1684936.1 50S ribosomal protein L5 [Patescibacteria group bacterium]MBU1939036.1 50S ribosomal protein L5 [Patescibacteria group bacterium]
MTYYDTFNTEVIPALQKELGIKNRMAVPRISKVKLNVGIGTLIKNTKDYSDVISNVSKIAGQKPVVTKAKIAISNFKLRQGMPTGITVTLRGKRMYEFIYRLVNIVIPRVRDFRGLNPKSFDGQGNYSIGFREALVFPEISPDDVLNVHGIQVTISTTAKNDEEGRAILTQIGFPFKKMKQ